MSRKGRILLVDDDVDFVRSMADLLEAHGYDIISAHDGTSGFAKAKQERPDLMVLDVMMATNTEGFEVARKIPLSEELRHMPVLLVTGIRNAMKLGFKIEPDETWLPVNRIMEKPIDPASFVAAVDDLIRKHDQLDWKHAMDRGVKSMLASKGGAVQTISGNATVLEAAKKMAQYHVNALPVMAGDRMEGICTMGDLAKRVIVEDRPAKGTKVSDIMTQQVVFVTSAQSIDECMALMTHKNISYLPVLDNGKLTGIISIGDVVRASLSQKNLLIDQLESYITRG